MEQLCQQQTSDTDPEDGVVVPEIQCPLSEQSLAILQGLIDPLIEWPRALCPVTWYYSKTVLYLITFDF